MQPMSASGVARPLPWRAPIPAFWLREIPVFALGAILGQQLVRLDSRAQLAMARYASSVHRFQSRGERTRAGNGAGQWWH